MNIRDIFKTDSPIRKILIIGLAFVVLAILFFVLLWSGLALIFIVVMAFVALIAAVIILWRKLQKYQYLDLMQEAYLQLYRATLLAQFQIEVPFYFKQHENATIQGFIGIAQGRTMLPVDFEIDKNSNEEQNLSLGQKLLAEMGEPEKVQRAVYNEDNKLEIIKEENIIWVVRVKQPSWFGNKQILCIVADSQISNLCRDASGDLSIGMPILAYGQWIPLGNFYVLWNVSEQLDVAIKGVKTVTVKVALEKYINRLAQITRMDTKTRPEIVEKKEVHKREEEAELG